MRRYPQSIAVVLAAIVLFACSAGLSLSERAFVACSGYASALSSLATHKRAGRLSEGDMIKVDLVRASMGTLCAATVFTPATVDGIESNVSKLLKIKDSANGS